MTNGKRGGKNEKTKGRRENETMNRKMCGGSGWVGVGVDSERKRERERWRE